MRIAVVYFSATGNTCRMARVIGDALAAFGAELDFHDITSHADRRNPVDMSLYDAIVTGAPIHSCRAPRVVRDWLSTLDGQGKPCAQFFTYGGFGVHPTHYSTWEILKNGNFRVVASAEFLGAHTFNLGGWKAMTGRPDASDDAVACEFARVLYRRFSGEDPAVLKAETLDKSPYSEEELDRFEAFRFNALTQVPTRSGKACSMCMMCEELCPNGAMNAVSGKAEKERCIACLRCVAVCPEHVLTINDMTPIWEIKLQMEKTSPEILNTMKSKIYL